MYPEYNSNTSNEKKNCKNRRKQSQVMQSKEKQNDKKLQFDELRDQKSIFTLIFLLHDYLFEHFDVS